MKRILGLIIILIGGIAIGAGLYFQVGNKELTTKKNKDEVDQTLVRANTHSRPTGCKDGFKDTYIQLTDFTKVSFSYPTCVVEAKLSYKRKSLTSEDNAIKFEAGITSDKPKGYLNTQRTFLISLKDNEYYKDFEFTDVKEIELSNGEKYYYFNVTYMVVGYGDVQVLHDEWYMAYPYKNSESGEEKTLTFTLSSQEKVIDGSVINSIMKSVKIEENGADYSHGKVEGDYIVGSIKQNKYKDYNHGYILKYKYPKDVEEVASMETDINSVVFTYEEVNKSKYVSVTIDNSYQNAKAKAESYNKIQKDDSTETHKNIKASNVKYKVVNNRNVYYTSVSYDVIHSETKKYLKTIYITYCFVELGENDFVQFYFSNDNIPITEEYLDKYLNFEVEEY